ncbi:hypothetical protein CI238_12727 [Colletotrichum incanum]|uniref:Uncharacterized protein n=1 Tax=Colletotrichum incanum TaxID=1573173 RepID=A0A161VHI1_COLIC|nr:hypothetical protein CI238_12727 [Colletotrichum incanum]
MWFQGANFLMGGTRTQTQASPSIKRYNSAAEATKLNPSPWAIRNLPGRSRSTLSEREAKLRVGDVKNQVSRWSPLPFWQNLT